MDRIVIDFPIPIKQMLEKRVSIIKCRFLKTETKYSLFELNSIAF